MSKLPKTGCKATIKKIGGELRVTNNCVIPRSITKVSTTASTKGTSTKRKLNPIVKAECKGTRGKERNECIKAKRKELRLLSHEEKVSKYQELGVVKPHYLGGSQDKEEEVAWVG